jgi:hypothetical protein
MRLFKRCFERIERHIIHKWISKSFNQSQIAQIWIWYHRNQKEKATAKLFCNAFTSYNGQILQVSDKNNS